MLRHGDESIVLCAQRQAWSESIGAFFADETMCRAIEEESPRSGVRHNNGGDFPKTSGCQPTGLLFESLGVVVRPIFTLILNLLKRNNNLRTTRDLLLPKLISGEVSVEAADEQAAELMEQTA